jgi:putative GTP pyrophosphokinase
VKALHDVSQAYSSHGQSWKVYLEKLRVRVEEMLEQEHVKASCQARVKTLESLSEKRGFLARSSGIPDPEIKDLLGLRVIVPFQESVEQVVQLLQQHYQGGDVERKSEKLSFREFAYDSVHVEVPLTEDLQLPACCRPVVEIQVRTILQDAWAEVEHELIYKNHFRFPNNEVIRKKLAAINASLSLADMIFQEIRDAQKEMERWGQERFKAMLDQAGTQIDMDTGVQLVGVDVPQGTLPGLEAPGTTPRAELERLLLAGLRAHNDKDYPSAVSFYTKVLDASPDLHVRSVVFNHRGMAYFMLQQEALALSDFDRSFQCDNTYYRALNNRALVLRRMGYIQPALECFQMSLEREPRQAEVYFLRAQTLVEIERHAEAHADLLQALVLEPNHREAMQLLADLDRL